MGAPGGGAISRPVFSCGGLLYRGCERSHRGAFMISDVLYEAVTEIRWYQKNYPAAYAALNLRIDKVVDQMEKLRAVLDAPPRDVGFVTEDTPRADAH